MSGLIHLHPLLGSLRLYAYELAFGEEVDDVIETHISDCPKCQFWLATFRATDAVLTGEDAASVNALARTASRPTVRSKASGAGGGLLAGRE